MGQTVLVVDDDVSILEFVQMALEDEGYTVRLAYNGAIALEILERHEDVYCLILLDMKMPIMDGHQFLQSYCESQGNPVPIIVFSANAKLEAHAYCIKAFIPKPFDLTVLLDVINKYASSTAHR
jgi:CheY-like chemotaxis protein